MPAPLGALPAWQRTLWIMFIAQLMSSMGFAVTFPFLPLYVEDLGTRTSLSIEFWAGMVFSAQAFTMMLASPIWGAVADRYGRKLMVQRAMFGGTIILGLMAFARTAEELVLLRAIQGVITGTIGAANALVASQCPRARVGYAMGVLQVGLWGGLAVGPLLGGVLADHYGYRIPQLVTAGMLFLAGLLVHFNIHEDFAPEQKAANKTKGFTSVWRHILSIRGVPQTYMISFLGGLARSMLIPIMPLFVSALLAAGVTTLALPFTLSFVDSMLPGNGGVSTVTGLAVGITSATATAGAVFFGRLGDKIGHRRVVIGCGLGAMVCFVPQVFVTEAWQLVVLQGFAGLAGGGIVSGPSALLARYTEPGEEGAVYGIDNSVNSAARTLAPMTGSLLAVGFGFRMAFAGVVGVFLALVIVAVLFLPDEVRDVGAPDEDRERAVAADPDLAAAIAEIPLVVGAD